MNRFKLSLIGCCIGAMGLAGCNKPYDTPEYQDIAPNETAYLIKVDGDNNSANGQTQLQSEDFLKANRVATKQVQITHKWIQTGYWYVPDVVLIKVDRSPVTRLWTKDAVTGTSVRNEAVYVESADSVDLSMGWTCTAMINSEDTAKFLFRNPAGSLATVMDTEVLGRIQKVCQNVASRYPQPELPTHKGDLQKEVEQDLTTYYKERGITITNVGLYGGLTYGNPNIQKAIDDSAISAQLKVVAAAKLEAQSKDNERMNLAADGEAESARRKAKGIADAKLTTAEAEAKGIQAINDAIGRANNIAGLVALRQLEVQSAQAEKWNGQMPLWYMGGGSPSSMPNLLLSAPIPTTQPIK